MADAPAVAATSLFSRLLEHAGRSPDAVVVRDRAHDWTWRSLLGRAAAYAEALGPAPQGEEIVPVLVDRSGESAAAILGALLSGRAFAPLSPDQPRERIKACLAAIGFPHIILTKAPAWGEADWRDLDIAPLVLPEGKTAEPVRPADAPAERLLYVLFTSGSTGTPKGVMVTAANIENTMSWSRDMLDWRPDDVQGNVAPFFFDISMFDLFTTFYFGVPLAILSQASDVHATLDEVERFAISSIFSAPLFFSQFLRTGLLGDARLGPVRRIVSGGDFFPPAHILGWMAQRPQVEVWNVWGPTETSIVNTMHRVTAEDVPAMEQGRHPPVGRAHPLMPFRLRREDGTLVEAPGEQGEICMTGPCVTRGYLADPARTADAYIMIEGERAFRTKDLGCLDAEGNLYMMGRIGSMVKVSGYRVDLGEVESAAARVAEVLLSAAFVHEPEPGVQQLHLAIELRNYREGFDIFPVKQQLRAMLPAYMVPKRIHVSPMLPRSPNGKIDRRAVARAFAPEAAS